MDISEASTNEDDLREEERNVRLLAKQMLKSREFNGYFKERKRLEALNVYRDVIVVTETQLKKDMDFIRKRLRNVYKNCWIGIQVPQSQKDPNPEHCFWIDVQDEFRPGNYEYKIKTVQFHRNEIIVRVKNLRNLDDVTQNLNESIEDKVSEYIRNFSWEQTKQEIVNASLEFMYWFFTTMARVLTVENIQETLKFLLVLLFASGAFLIQCVKFFMIFILKFMKEFTQLVKAFTPVMQSIIDVFGKIIGGFYFLIAMIYRDSRGGGRITQYQTRQRYLPIEARQRQPVQYYRPKSSVVITEIN